MPFSASGYVSWLGVPCVLTLASVAWGESPVASRFSEEPADALVRRLEPGLGFSMALAGETKSYTLPFSFFDVFVILHAIHIAGPSYMLSTEIG